ncbi:MAG TPA: YbgF trimerization domain-containing protein, partial [Gammaproteobacteria bacterium]|nr:YbgF trimerization domain-containing protein [Gammaproteobacteria bacterium]
MNKRLLLPIAMVALTVVSVLPGTPASAARRDEEEALELRITDLEARLIRIEKILENQSLIQLANELEQLRNDTKTLRGQIDQLRYESQNAATRQRDLYVDVDKRLQSLEQAQRAQAALPPAQPPGGFAGSTPSP